MHVIFLVTVPHTGTHFMRNMFRDMPARPWMVEIRQVHTAKCGLHSLRSGVIGFDPRRLNLLTGHFHDQLLDTIEAVAEHWTPIVPLRDPLAAMITAMPSADIGRLLGNWAYLVQKFDKLSTPHYVPLDLMRTNQERREGLTAAVKAAGCQGLAGIERHVNEYAANWAQNRARANSRRSYPLKDAYLRGDMVALEQQMAQPFGELRKTEPWLRPFLERHGYRDLQWWTPETGSDQHGAA